MNEIFWIIKLLGVGCVLFGSTFLGLAFGRRMEFIYEEYEGLRFVLLNLFRNQNYLRLSFPELFIQTAERLKRENSINTCIEIETRKLGERLPKMEFEEAWRIYLEALTKSLKLNENLKNQLKNTGGYLQGMDAEGIEIQISLTLEILQEELNRQRKEIGEKKKIALSCCIMVGLFAIIVLI